jgi:hypothetical protein
VTTGRPRSPWERLEWHESREGWRPWEPPTAPGLAARMPSYVVVDEIVGDAVGVAIHPWPLADRKGRLRFTDYGEGRFAGTSRTELQTWVDEHRVAALGPSATAAVTALATRPLAIGDVFSATTDAEGAGVPPEALLGSDFVDLTLDAREAAKLAFYGAVGRPLDEDEAPRWIDMREEDDEPPTATGTPMPVPR